jgi:hypothetical protein
MHEIGVKMEPMTVVFSGGPANGKLLVVPDGRILEYHFPMILGDPELIGDPKDISDRVEHRTVVYHRTESTKDGAVIFEFIGII